MSLLEVDDEVEAGELLAARKVLHAEHDDCYNDFDDGDDEGDAEEGSCKVLHAEHGDDGEDDDHGEDDDDEDTPGPPRCAVYMKTCQTVFCTMHILNPFQTIQTPLKLLRDFKVVWTLKSMENGNTSLWKRADGGRPVTCPSGGGGEPPSPSNTHQYQYQYPPRKMEIPTYGKGLMEVDQSHL